MNDLILRNVFSRTSWVISAAFVSILMVAASASGQAARANDSGEAKYETKVYNIADLLDGPLMLDYEPDGSRRSSGGSGFGFGSGGFGGGGFGGGQVGGGQAGGGGMFRVPDNILPQFGGGGGGFGGGGQGGLVSPQMTPPTDFHMDTTTLESIVLDHISDETTKWMTIDGEGGRLSVVGTMMIVTHTADVHARLVKLLDALRIGNNTSPAVQVDVRIVEVASDQTVASLTADAKATEELANDESAARLSLRCNNHRAAEVSSGLRRSYVVSLTPVVGSNGFENKPSREIAYQPVTYSPLLGLFGRIKPEISADQKTGRIHLGIQLVSGPEEVIAATFGTGQSIDRVELEMARLGTAVSSVADKWTLAGSVAVTDPNSAVTSGAALPHLAILVRWTVVD